MKKSILMVLALGLVCGQLFAQESQSEENKPEILKQVSHYDEVAKYFHFGVMSNVDFFNPESDVKIISLGILTANDANITGIQEAIFLSKTEGTVTGYQTAGIGNFAKGGFIGYQSAGVFNHAGGQSYGLQEAAAVNIAQDISGVQLSYFFNKAKKVRGAQIGLVNYAEENNGATFGLINIVKNGVHDLGVSFDSDRNVWITIQEGADLLYTNIGFGFNPTDDKEFFAASLGLGSRLKKGCLSFDFEAMWKYVFCQDVVDTVKDIKDLADDNDGLDDLSKEDKDKLNSLRDNLAQYQIPSIKFTVNYNPMAHLTVFASASCDLRVEDWNDKAYGMYVHNLNGSVSMGGKKVTFYPAFAAGIKVR